MGIKYIDEENKSESSAGKIKYVDEGKVASNPKSRIRAEDIKSNLLTAGGAMAGVGAVAGGVGKIIDPWVQNAQLNSRQINPLKSQFGIDPRTLPQDLPSAMRDKMEEMRTRAIKSAGETSTIQSRMPDWSKEAYTSWDNRIAGIKNNIRTTGLAVPLNTGTFKDNVLNQAASQIESIGLTRESDAIRRFSNTLESSNPIQFDEVVDSVNNLGKSNPTVKKILTDKLADYLATDKVASETQAGKEFKSLRDDYFGWKSLSRDLSKVSKISNLEKYAQGSGNPMTGKILRSAASGTRMTKPIPGLSELVDQLDEVRKGMEGIKEGTQKARELARISKSISTRIRSRLVVGGAIAGLGSLWKLGSSIANSMGLMGVMPTVAPKNIDGRQYMALERFSPIEAYRGVDDALMSLSDKIKIKGLSFPGTKKKRAEYEKKKANRPQPKKTPQQELDEMIRLGLIA